MCFIEWLLLLSAVSLNHISMGQTESGQYPSITALSAFRPVESSSVCGQNGAENYCVFTTDSTASLLPNCNELQCNNTCPFGSSTPAGLDLAALSGSFGSGVSATQGRPGSSAQAIRFQNSSISIAAANLQPLSSNGFSFALWVNQDQGNEGAVFSKEGIYSLTVSSTSLIFMYQPRNGGSGMRSFSVEEAGLDERYWHHIALTVFQEDAAIYINGTLAKAEPLISSIADDASREIKLGQIDTIASSYNGRLQDIFYYNQALTAREVMESFTGSLPFLHLSSECRCPPSHPVINQQNQGSCTQHPGVGLVPRGNAVRLNADSHPVGYINDLSRVFRWVSAPGVRSVNITLNLTNHLYEVFLVTIQFSAPRPKAAILESSRDGGLTFEPVQYFADDCMFYFGLPNNGPILAADDVNCVTSISFQIPTFNGNLRFRFINQAVRNYDLDTSPEFRRFISASHLRLRLVDYFTDSTSLRHQYYSIQEIAVAARCACNGHSSRCGNAIDSVCQCEHFTTGPNCDSCLPTHSDKPWRYGTTENAFPCKPCRCNGHASTCVYNSSVDPFPNSYDVGGGGVCQNCEDNTAGANCDSCVFGFFRPTGRLASDPSPCDPCACNPNGITDTGDCVKDQGGGGQIIGQCFCKRNVIGLKCDVCRPGFSNLTMQNPDGCAPCGCNTAGTFNAVDTCDVDSGQCLCKDNVQGLKCDTCRPGTTSLDASNPLGCSGCSCDSVGAVSSDCDSVTGVCTCKPGVTGSRCDQCMPGFFGFSDSGCQECACDPVGSVSGICDSVSGACSCRSNVAGNNCDTCATGFYNISTGCLPCGCNSAGTVNSTMSCDPMTGLCPCKTNVQGRTCDTCSSGFTALLASNQDGCSACNCFGPNSAATERICDPITTQCDCVAAATGLRCEQCRDGYYLASSGCEPCGCDLMGSNSSVCDKTTGDCSCTSEGVTGRTCNTCLSGFFQFPSCLSCGCDPAGAVAGSVCDQTTGVCSCKQFVTGTSCDRCVEGFQNLEESNPLGCSAAPDELAPPTLTPSSTSIVLTWLPPEVPNGFIVGYRVFQDGVLVANVSGLTYTSDGLQPNSQYSFFLEAFTSAGSTRSSPVTGSTLEGAPTGLAPPTLTPINSSSVMASWRPPTETNGVIVRYDLIVLELEVTVTGPSLSAIVSDLLPFTNYSFVVVACTSGGCVRSLPAQVRTLEAPPTFQPPPNATALTAATVLVEWEEPEVANGILALYEVRRREFPFTGDGESIGNVTSNITSFMAAGLQSFTAYEFSVTSYSGGGATQSAWTRVTTGESVPSSVQPPVLTAISSTQIRVSWSPPLTPNGVIVNYTVFSVMRDGSGEVQVATAPLPGSALVEGLSPFLEYFFILEACTVLGCARSQSNSIFTQEGVPSGQPAPEVNTTASSSVTLLWEPPTSPNGIISSYSLLRRSPSFAPSPLVRDVGVAFDGNVLRRFSGSDHFLGGTINTITLSFRTFLSTGTLLYYINAAGTDYIALELRGGIPWFFFDAGSGPGVVRPDLSGADVVFNDGAWHSVTAVHNSRTGMISVDGTYSGSGASSGSDQVISSRQVLYIGGIPDSIPRGTTLGLSTTPNSTLEGLNFAGCLFGVTLNNQLLDFTLGEGMGDEVIPGVAGCPLDLEPGWSFLGGGFLSFPPGTINSNRFSWSFDIRTTHTEGLVLLALTPPSPSSNNSALALEVRGSLLYLILSSQGSTQQASINASICDGEWHTVLVDQSRDEVFVSVDGRGTSLFLPSPDIVFSSDLFCGGVPMETAANNAAQTAGVNIYAPFSGCARPRPQEFLVGGVPIAPEPSAHYLVRFDGCHRRGREPVCGGPWVTLPSVAETEYTDTGLRPWTEYMYRVRAHNSAGLAASRWVPAITAEGAATGVGVVSVVSTTSSSLTTSWTTPNNSNGLITQYEVNFDPVRTEGLDTPIGTSRSVSLSVTMPEMVLLAMIDQLQPATTYSTTLRAFTIGGVGSGSPVELTTDEAPPSEVQAPIVMGVGSRELTVTWAPPTIPNGVIILYELLVDGDIRFSGTSNTTIVLGLQPFTEYSLRLQACTGAGCANSSRSIGQTLPDAPSGLAPPTLTVLSPSSIQARWSFPDQPNGEITRFQLRRILNGDPSFVVVFDDLGASFELETTITGLTPSTNYTFQLLAFNAGGSTASALVHAFTLEDIPDDISPPGVDVVTSTTLGVSWSPPGTPNGDIILYNLTLNGEVVFSTESDLSYVISNLRPFTLYSLSIIACTVRGCGSSNGSTVRTLEDVPFGYIQPAIINVSPREIVVVVNPVEVPNGVARYLLYVDGPFPSSPTAELGDIAEARRTVPVRDPLPRRVQLDGLIPFRNYTLTLNVSNSAGTLEGESFNIETESALPEGFASPTLTLVSATSVLVEWEEPILPNGIILGYQAHITPLDSSITLEPFSRDPSATMLLVEDLRAFTLYEVVLSVINTQGGTSSPPVNITTGQTAPSGFDRIVLLEQGARHTLLSWDPPAMSNGILVNYTVLQGEGGVVIAATPPEVLQYNVTGLVPFTSYNFSVLACTEVACVQSPALMAMTLEDVPEGLLAPFVPQANPGQPVVIAWSAPSSPFGVILNYTVQRREELDVPDTPLTIVGTLPGSAPSLVLADRSTMPFTLYAYRVVAENSAGSVASEFTVFLSPEAAPEGVAPPVVAALSSSALQVSFMPPLRPQGNITMYTVTRSPSLRTFTFTPSSLPLLTPEGTYVFNDTGLSPFTEYSYILRVCTSGGCTNSNASAEFTLEDVPTGIAPPTTVAVSFSEIRVEWVEPSMPNGVIQSYDVFRVIIGYESETAEALPLNCCDEFLQGVDPLPDQCTRVTSTNLTSHLDSNLDPFTFYAYCLVATNNAESGFSRLATPTQTSPAPMPLRGPVLNATTLNSTAVYLEWDSLDVSDLLGPLQGYTLHVRVSGTPGLGEVLIQGTQEQEFVATELQPSTEYVFVVLVSNGAGATPSNNATATTEEGIPAGLPAPELDPVRSDALSILILEPLLPNGEIILYNIYLDGRLVLNVTRSGRVLLEGLLPFTLYTVQLEACTRFGCSPRSPLVGATSLESAPVGLGSPFVTVTGPMSVDISWMAPNQPNGNVTMYHILQQEGTGPEVVIFSGFAFQFSVIDLQPFTSYGFQVVAENGAGNVTSIPTSVTTLQAPPTGFDAPIVTVLSATEISVSWSPPEQLNGEFIGYLVYQNGEPIFVDRTSELVVIQTGLLPFTTYEFFVEVCAGGGCLNSSSVRNTTFEALPEMTSDLFASNISGRSLVLMWEEPDFPNGLITEYIVTDTGAERQIFRGLSLTVEITSLTPFTDYSYHLMTCNGAGCVTSNVTEVRTLEADPEGLDPPETRNLTSTSVAISWSVPSEPNGIIASYILRRGNDSFPNISQVIFQGLATSFNDMNLVADTLYFYTVEAVNGRGSVISARSFYRTVPDLAEGIRPPVLTVQGATEIAVTWFEPESPNGEISAYRVYQDGALVFTTPAGFFYVSRNLQPFTSYTFFVEVCNQAGCASSISVTNQTEEALATGVAPPTLTALSPTAVTVSWAPPARPNGVVTEYQIFRRIVTDIFSELIAFIGPATTLSFQDSGLTPFTGYEYRLRVRNGAGSASSTYSLVRTSEALPAGISLPVFEVDSVFARNVTATWAPPTMPNGIILRYVLEYRLSVDPITLGPGAIMIAEEVLPNITTAVAAGLTPVTSYEFRVRVVNNAGSGEGPFEVVTTGEDVPEGVQPIIVQQRTGSSLVLTWNPPLTSHGVIREYQVLVDGGVVYRDSALTYTVQRLQPFTSYDVQLAACTSAGCSFGSVQSVTTAEVAPVGQARPTLNIDPSGNVIVTWTPPAQPNGIITRYQVLRRVSPDPSSPSPPDVLSVVFSTEDIANQTFTDATVSPAQSYQYVIRAGNSAGTTDSDFAFIMTPEAAPLGLTPPIVLTHNATAIQVSWLPPTQPNGILTMYRVYRSGGGASNVSVFSDPASRGFVDSELSPFTSYTYVVQACTAAGCSESSPSVATTSEAPPTDLSPPMLGALSEASISIEWEEPQSPNGVIVSYSISILPVQINIVLNMPPFMILGRNVSNLQPFTNYTVSLVACNSAGCVSSSASVRTLESLPGFIIRPQVIVVNATALNVTWVEPVMPNGVIVRYQVRRSGSVVFDGNALTFVEAGLTPVQEYSYTVQAYTAVGPGPVSDPSTPVQTPRDTPEGVFPPTLRPTTSSSINASWVEPATPNGVIQRYVLFLNEVQIFDGLLFSFEVSDLQPFTSYSFRLEVCTTTCGTSTSVSATTLEAPPLGQAPPRTVEAMDRTVDVSWSVPTTPNGVIVRYEVERRMIGGEPSSFVSIFSGSALTFLDSDSASLLPATSYQYRVTSFNSAGSVTSEPSSTITLSEAPPLSVPLPQHNSTTSTSISLLATPPDTPNGVIISYRLNQNGTQVQEIQPPNLNFLVTNLQVYTVYRFTVEACTSAGCTASGSVFLRTGEAPPAGLAPPMGVAQSSREIRISWNAPQQPNGVILSYALWYRRACPQPPTLQISVVTPTCEVGPVIVLSESIPSDQVSFQFSANPESSNNPLPHVAYEFMVGVTNSEGSVNSTYSEPDTVTPAGVPVMVGEIVLQTNFETRVITLDWGSTFRLDGILRHYDVTRNGVLLTRSTVTTISLPREPVGTNLTYVIFAVTTVGTASATINTRLESGTGPQTQTTADTATVTSEPTVSSEPTEIPFYEEPAFIVGMVVLGIVILFLLCAIFLCCVRPRGEKQGVKGGLQVSHSFRIDPDHSHLSPKSAKGSPERKLPKPQVTGSWSPGDPITEGEIPDIETPSEIFALSPPTSKMSSYSPSKVEYYKKGDQHRLSDIVISNTPSIRQFGPAKDDFGSFKPEHQQQTFQDTKV